jgi:hypothetical protein
MKSVFTSKKRTIESKGKDPFQVNDYCRYVLLSNKFVQPLLSDEARRYAVFEVSNKKKNNYEYFKTLIGGFTQEAANAFLYYLLYKVDLSKFNIRDIPSTSIREEIIQSNKSSPYRFLATYDWGCISENEDTYEPGEILIYEINKKNMALATDVYAYYKVWCKYCGEKWLPFKEFIVFIRSQVDRVDLADNIFIIPIDKKNIIKTSKSIREVNWLLDIDIRKLPKLPS